MLLEESWWVGWELLAECTQVLCYQPSEERMHCRLWPEHQKPPAGAEVVVVPFDVVHCLRLQVTLRACSYSDSDEE